MSATKILANAAVVDGVVSVPTDEVDRALQAMPTKGRKTRVKRDRDPKEPKRPMNAFFLWKGSEVEAILAELKTKNPDAKYTDASKEAGARWKEMTDDEKAPFVADAAKLKEVYDEAKAEWAKTQPEKPKKVASKEKYDVDEMPDAPEGWSGAFQMKYLYRKVKGADGKPVRIQKNFQNAVDLANEILAAWAAAKESDEMPDHWSADTAPCAGITKTGTGYDLRLGPDLMSTAEKDSKGGLASWMVGEHSDTVTTPPVQDEPVKTPDAPKKKRGRKAKAKSATPPAAETTPPPAAETTPPPAAEEKPKSATPPAAEEKPKKKAYKVKAKKAEEPKGVNVDDCEVIGDPRFEDDEDAELLLHEETEKVYSKDDLINPVGYVNNDTEDLIFY
jgi:hypothetical protein